MAADVNSIVFVYLQILNNSLLFIVFWEDIFDLLYMTCRKEYDIVFA